VKLSAAEVAVACAKAGWRGIGQTGDLTVAVAVALAASGGMVDQPGGLFAMSGAPADALGQAVAAHAKWATEGWGWSAVHRSRRYLLFVPTAAVAVTAAGVAAIVSNPAGAVSGVLGEAAKTLPGDSILDTAKGGLAVLVKAGVWLGDRENWVRVSRVVLGGALIIGAAVVIAKPAIAGGVGVVGSTVVKPLVKSATSKGR
jgi:hypothetical protein